VLTSGNHPEIARWREQQKLERTRERRADLLPDDTKSK
jgi:tRNA (guanine37-N1)-methyltransferase